MQPATLNRTFRAVLHIQWPFYFIYFLFSGRLSLETQYKIEFLVPGNGSNGHWTTNAQCTVHGTIYNAQCTVHGRIYNAQCTVHGRIYNAQCTVHGTIYNAQCTLHGRIYNTQCTVHGT